MKSYRKELWFEVPSRRGFINITPTVVISGLKTSQNHRIKTSTHNVAQTAAYQEISTTDFLRPIPVIF